MEYFREVYGQVMEFDYLQGMFPFPGTVGNGIAPGAPTSAPYFSWTLRVNATYTSGLDEMSQQIANKIEQDGPYDGFIGFSQGSVVFRLFWTIVNELDPDL